MRPIGTFRRRILDRPVRHDDIQSLEKMEGKCAISCNRRVKFSYGAPRKTSRCIYVSKILHTNHIIPVRRKELLYGGGKLRGLRRRCWTPYGKTGSRNSRTRTFRSKSRLGSMFKCAMLLWPAVNMWGGERVWRLRISTGSTDTLRGHE